MTPSKNNILVKFDPLPTIGGIIAPERYLIQEADQAGENNAYGVTTDRKSINPQVITILSGPHEGKRAFVYYGAYEIAQWPEPELAIIPESTIFFFIDPIKPVVATYLGEEVFSEGDKTASGIYTTPYAEMKEGILVKITHTPKEGQILYGDKFIVPGDIVVTIDQHQYDLRFENKKYIKLRATEIVAVQTKDGYVPIGDRVLIEYLADDDLKERIAENDRKSGLRDFMTKNYLHYTETDLEPLKEPTFTKARLIAIGNAVKLTDLAIQKNGLGIELCGGNTIKGHLDDTVFVFRNYGQLLKTGQWITSIENVIGVLV